MQRRNKSYVRPRYYRQWTEEEEGALQRGVERHGVGSWESIRKDPELGILRERTGVQLKDKWRNMVKFKHVPHVLGTKASAPATAEGSKHSESLSGAMRSLDLRNSSEGEGLTPPAAPPVTTDEDQEGSGRGGSRHGRKSRTRRPQSALEDKRFGIYDVRRYLNKSASAASDLAVMGNALQPTDATPTLSAGTSDSPSAGSSGEEQGVVRCVCGAHTDDGLMMVECERCFVWSHIHCLQELAANTCFQLNLQHYVCASCQGLNVQGLIDTMASSPLRLLSHPTLPSSQHNTTMPNLANDLQTQILSPFAAPHIAPEDMHLTSDESIMDSLAAYQDHPEGKVHGGSLAMYALAATSLDATAGTSEDLFAEMPGLEQVLAEAAPPQLGHANGSGALSISAQQTLQAGQHHGQQHNNEDEFGVWGMVLSNTEPTMVDNGGMPSPQGMPTTAPRSCPQPSPMMMSWPLQHMYGGGALAASLSSGMSGNTHGPMSVGSAATHHRGNSPPSSMSYASSGDVFGATPPSSVLPTTMPPVSPSGYSLQSKRNGMLSAVGTATHHVARGGVTKVTGGGVHRLDALSASTSSLEYISKTWFPDATSTPPVQEAGSPSTTDSHAHMTPPLPATTVADADLSALDVVLFSEQEWPLQC